MSCAIRVVWAASVVVIGMAGVDGAFGRDWIVAQQHPAATDDGPGDASRPFATITAAALVAGPNDRVVVRAGVYRERVAPVRSGEPNRPIVYTAAPDERVVIKAMDWWRPRWRAVEGSPGVVFGRFADDQFDLDRRYAAGWDDFPARFNPYTRRLRPAGSYSERAALDPYGRVAAGESGEGNDSLCIGQLFVNGRPLRQVAGLEHVSALPGTWTVAPDADGLYVHFPSRVGDPSKATVELTTRPRCFAPYHRGRVHHIHVRGFVMEGGASDFHAKFYDHRSPQVGVLGTRAGRHWVIENNVIRFGKTLGMDIGTEGDRDADGLGQRQPRGAGPHLIRNNRITDNGAGGIQGIRSRGTRIIGNVIERNNRLGFTSPEIGGIKLHFFESGLIEGNLVRNNDCYGIWLDNMWHNARVSRNAVLSNQGVGVFIEMGFGPLMIDNNVIALTRGSTQVSGDGIYSHDASGVTVAHNLVFHNANFGLWAHIGTDRHPGVYRDGRRIGRRRCESSGWRVVNNLIIGNHGGAVGLPAEHPRATANHADDNLYAASYNRWTLETFGDALDRPVFVLNNNKGRVDREALVSRFAERLAGADVPAAERPGMARWLDLPYLRLDEWRMLTGHDRHSRFAVVLRTMASTRTPYISFVIGTAPTELGCERIDGVQRDYFGNRIEAEPLPGPFQNLVIEPRADGLPRRTEGRGPFVGLHRPRLNHITLWPRPEPPAGGPARR